MVCKPNISQSDIMYKSDNNKEIEGIQISSLSSKSNARIVDLIKIERSNLQT